MFEFRDNTFRKLGRAEARRMNNSEALLWMSMHLMVSMDVLCKYNENSQYSRNQLLKVRGLITPEVIDQIPILYELKNYLERLSLMNASDSSNFSSIRVVSHSSWQKELGRDTPSWAFNPSCIKVDSSSLQFKTLVDGLMEMYLDQMDLKSKQQAKKELQGKGTSAENEEVENKCARCEAKASKRCSDCQKFFYCSKNCQKKDLKSNHKNECRLHSEYVQKCLEYLKKKKNKKNQSTAPKDPKKPQSSPTPVVEKKEENSKDKKEETITAKSQSKEFANLKSAVLLGRGDKGQLFKKLDKLARDTKPSGSKIPEPSEETSASFNPMDELD